MEQTNGFYPTDQFIVNLFAGVEFIWAGNSSLSHCSESIKSLFQMYWSLQPICPAREMASPRFTVEVLLGRISTLQPSRL